MSFGLDRELCRVKHLPWEKVSSRVIVETYRLLSGECTGDAI